MARFMTSQLELDMAVQNMPRHESKRQTDMLRLAILGVYQNVAFKSVDWSSIADRATLIVFTQPKRTEAEDTQIC
jgi:hypothetical protein